MNDATKLPPLRTCVTCAARGYCSAEAAMRLLSNVPVCPHYARDASIPETRGR